MSKLLTLRVTLSPPNQSEVFGANADAYMEGVETVFRTSVFKYLELLIKYGRRKTGRLVAGFTAMMDQYGYDYMRSWQHSDEESTEAVEEGKELSTYDYQEGQVPINITITNAVEYAEYVENKVGMTEIGQLPILVPYFEQYIGENMDIFMENAIEGFHSGDYGDLEDFGAPEAN
ncbi:MAG: hypothetical protein KGL39_33865 [Patescibacteria group bacterium]|nr:hypothetical protein [Patescibacteria group bacterium]